MSRLILVIAAFAVIYLLIKSFRMSPKKSETPSHAEDMVRCKYCGVHIPKGESIISNGDYYCSETHLRDYQSSH
jgi:uncharacterized protein